MVGYAGVPSNLPDIDADDMFAPEAYRRWVGEQGNAGEAPASAGAGFGAPGMEQRHSDAPSYHEVPRYQELDYGAFPTTNNDIDYYPEAEKVEPLHIGRTPLRQVGFDRSTTRYATPELEGQANRLDDHSFDGPEDYASTADGEHITASGRRTRVGHGANPAERTPTIRRRFGLYRSTNSKQNKDSSRSLARTLDDEKSGIDNDDEPLNQHFGPAPTVQLRRNRTKRRIGLTAGNLVIDAPIPSRLAGFLPRKGTEEFDKMRYVYSCSMGATMFHLLSFLLCWQVHGSYM